MITIIDYGSGNINAIKNVYERLNISFEFATTKEQITKADHILLPGVGAFDETISTLQDKGFTEVLKKKVLEEKVPLLGICVGMQMLADSSEEGILNGFGWIHGKVKKFDKDLIPSKPKLPHLGWPKTIIGSVFTALFCRTVASSRSSSWCNRLGAMSWKKCNLVE